MSIKWFPVTGKFILEESAGFRNNLIDTTNVSIAFFFVSGVGSNFCLVMSVWASVFFKLN